MDRLCLGLLQGFKKLVMDRPEHWRSPGPAATITPMPNGSLSLAEYPAAMVWLKCDKCARAGQYRKTALIQKYSPDIPLPELLRFVAGDCPILRSRPCWTSGRACNWPSCPTRRCTPPGKAATRLRAIQSPSWITGSPASSRWPPKQRSRRKRNSRKRPGVLAEQRGLQLFQLSIIVPHS